MQLRCVRQNILGETSSDLRAAHLTSVSYYGTYERGAGKKDPPSCRHFFCSSPPPRAGGDRPPQPFPLPSSPARKGALRRPPRHDLTPFFAVAAAARLTLARPARAPAPP